MIIYKITNKITGKIYIGQTVQSLNNRWLDHKSNARNADKYTAALYHSIRKHGVDNFIMEQVDIAVSLEELNLKEQIYIKALNSLVPNGYNLELGGGNKQTHPETRAKISAALKGRPIKNRMNGAPKGRPVSEERKARISKTLKGRSALQNNEPLYNKETGEFYVSQKEAATHLKVSRQTINQWTKQGKLAKIKAI